MRYVYLFITLAFLPLSVLAQEGDDACAYIEQYNVSESGADYVPGVNVRGEPVAPADLNQGSIDLPERIEFPLTLDIARYINQDVPQGIEMTGDLGNISVDIKTGDVFYNGKRITQSLKTYCENKLEEGQE